MTEISQRSVHYTGTEAVSRRTFIGSRYEVPLFLCKRLAVPVERRDKLELEVLQSGRHNLLQGMTNYGQLPNWKGDRFAAVPGASSFPSSSHGQHALLGEVYYERIPREMDKLAQPRRYFVGKIRPGNKSTERPCSRLTLSTATLCWRNSADPGPDRYFKGIFDIVPKGDCTNLRQQQLLQLPPAANRHSYCAEPFRRPPPGRYDLRQASAPAPALVRGQSRQRNRRREMTLNANWKPFRQPATLRMHTVDIPTRRRKRGRNMKVAFGSSTARFEDQEFFPIGALQSAIPGSGGQHQQRRPRRKISESAAAAAGGASNQQNHASSNFDADEPPTPTVATLDRTRTKLFIVPRRQQTVDTLARLLQLPPSQRGGPSEGSQMVTSRVKIEPVDDDDDEETDGPVNEEVLDDDDRNVDDEAVKTETVDEKSNSRDLN